MKIRKIIAVVLFGAAFIMMSTTVFAATWTRNTTYSIYHGVYTPSTSMKDNVTVTLIPTKACKSDLGLYLEKKTALGWRTPGNGINSAEVSSATKSTTVLGGGVKKGTYRVYIRNWDGVNIATGLAKFKWVIPA